ncbi:HsmA family protein [Candidatus Clostridium radicumherbarum]|jgi:TIGR03987 family protein|uniref:HsmA family protein n=1 Tax=Candidatus Clostridium radicumherbarum TaxID=3381662 RepID=A0ABW8TYL9_9CLOT
MLVYAASSITLALVFYTIGVWSEKRQGKLKLWHVIIFWCGLVCDTLGTTLMFKIAKDGFDLSFHGITGISAIILMLFHVLWATVVLLKNDEKMKLEFHKFSIMVWIIWLIPFISGAIFGMTH